MQYKKEEDLNYIDVMYEISLQCVQLKEFEEARGWIEKGISAARKDDRYKSLLYLLLILQYKYFEKTEVYKKFLETEALPFFKAEKNIKDLKKVYLELAEYFEGLLEFQESNRYYKLAIMLLEEEGGIIV
ncbi:transcriptional regulator, partial [Bacillus sp. JJ1127]